MFICLYTGDLDVVTYVSLLTVLSWSVDVEFFYYVVFDIQITRIVCAIFILTSHSVCVCVLLNILKKRSTQTYYKVGAYTQYTIIIILYAKHDIRVV